MISACNLLLKGILVGTLDIKVDTKEELIKKAKCKKHFVFLLTRYISCGTIILLGECYVKFK